MSNQKNVDAAACLAIPADAVARLLCISVRHLWGLNASGRVPRPVRLGRSVRWDRAELERWLAAGAPSRDHWEQLESQNNPRSTAITHTKRGPITSGES